MKQKVKYFQKAKNKISDAKDKTDFSEVVGGSYMGKDFKAFISKTEQMNKKQ